MSFESIDLDFFTDEMNLSDLVHGGSIFSQKGGQSGSGCLQRSLSLSGAAEPSGLSGATGSGCVIWGGLSRISSAGRSVSEGGARQAPGVDASESEWKSLLAYNDEVSTGGSAAVAAAAGGDAVEGSAGAEAFPRGEAEMKVNTQVEAAGVVDAKEVSAVMFGSSTTTI